jgi:putative phosphoribosyl transferase
MRFLNREEAGLFLAHAARVHRGPDVVVLAVPPGGVAVACAVAGALEAPLDVLLVRRVMAPGRPDLVIGAVAEGGVRHVDLGLAQVLGIPPAALGSALSDEAREVERQMSLYRGGRALPHLGGRTAVLVTDGIATGATARAAIVTLRRHGARRIVLAAPVAARSVVAALRARVEAIICLWQPDELHNVREWYEEFEEPLESQVIGWLERLRGAPIPEADCVAL